MVVLLVNGHVRIPWRMKASRLEASAEWAKTCHVASVDIQADSTSATLIIPQG